METDFIVIGKYRNREKVRELVEQIRVKGNTCYDFTAKPADPGNPNGSGHEQMSALESHPDFYNDPIHRDHFERDLAGLKGARTVVLLFPAGNSAHVEAGIAFGLGKKLVCIGEPEKPETLYFIFHEHYSTPEEFLNSF